MQSIGSSSVFMTTSAACAIEPVCPELLEVEAPWSQSLARFEICGDVTSAAFSAKISLAWLASEDMSRGFEGVEAVRETVGQVEGVGTAVSEAAGLAWLVILCSLSLDENAMRVANQQLSISLEQDLDVICHYLGSLFTQYGARRRLPAHSCRRGSAAGCGGAGARSGVLRGVAAVRGTLDDVVDRI
jgi:hypothetical protein